MSHFAEVRLWGTLIGAVSLQDGEAFASFEYNPEFLVSTVELSPLKMPLSRRVYRFSDLSFESFHGLPGLLADSLPDKFGTALIDAWLARQNRPSSSFHAIERLCYTGSRGMGALEFLPITGPDDNLSERLDVAELVQLASSVLSQKKDLKDSLLLSDSTNALEHILQIGTSAGGARAKVLIAWNRKSNEIRSGQIEQLVDFEAWLLKFDGVSNNRDKEKHDAKGYGAIEYTYSQMAKAAKIEMNECRLLEENGRHHFMTKRFDRRVDGQKLHMQTLAALTHTDYNQAGLFSYEQSFVVIHELGMGMDSVEKMFRRMVFNILARNQDDHVKNISFLMDRQGTWTLAPAYDLTYSYQPDGLWTNSHQMTVNGKRDSISFDDILSAGSSAGIKKERCKRIYREVFDAVHMWREFAEECGIPVEHRDFIWKNLRLGL